MMEIWQKNKIFNNIHVSLGKHILSNRQFHLNIHTEDQVIHPNIILIPQSAALDIGGVLNASSYQNKAYVKYQ